MAELDKQVQKRTEALRSKAPNGSGSGLGMAMPIGVANPRETRPDQALPQLNVPKQWAGQTFFFKNGQWQAENLSEDDLKNLSTITQLSEEYYSLAKKLKAEEMVWLSQKDPVVFKYEGVNYLIKPAS